MPAAYDFHIPSPVDAARDAVAHALRAQGFEIEASPNGSLIAQRGSFGLTMVIGALAGAKMHMRFDVQFFQNGAETVARLNRSLAGGALKGGAIGASKTADAFQDAAHQLGKRLHEQGILRATTEVAA
jgi:hypothetical protein